jgi:uncharacterized protein (TIGR00297 family)
MMDWTALRDNLLPGLAVNIVLAVAALAARTVSVSGFIGGLLVGIPIYLCLGWRGFVVLVGMFAIGTALTRLGYARKEAMGVAEAKRGARGASHAFANSGVAALAASAAWMTGAQVWNVAFVGALATASMDTAGSEVGPLWGKRTISLKTLRPVPPGTEGAVSAEGTLAGLVVALLLGGLGWWVGLLPSAAHVLAITLAAWIGNLYEGILGSRRLLPHTWLNATNTLVGALAAAALSLLG